MGVCTDSLPMLCGSGCSSVSVHPRTHKRQQGGKRCRRRYWPPRPPLTKGAEGSERRVSEKMGGPGAPFPQLRPPVPGGLRAPARRDSLPPAQAHGTPCCFTSLHRSLRARNAHQSEPKAIRNQKSRGASPHLQKAAPGRRKGSCELAHGPRSLRCVSAVWTVGSKPQQLCWQAGLGRRQRQLWPLCEGLPTV